MYILKSITEGELIFPLYQNTDRKQEVNAIDTGKGRGEWGPMTLTKRGLFTLDRYIYIPYKDATRANDGKTRTYRRLLDALLHVS